MSSGAKTAFVLVYPLLTAGAAWWLARSASEDDLAAARAAAAKAASASEARERRLDQADARFNGAERTLHLVDARSRELADGFARLSSAVESVKAADKSSPPTGVQTKNTWLSPEAAQRLIARFKDIPPTEGKERYSDESARKLDFSMLLPELPKEEVDRGVEGCIQVRIRTLVDNGAVLTEEQKTEFAQSARAYWPTIADLTKRMKTLNIRLRDKDYGDSTAEALTQRLNEIQREIETLHRQVNDAELAALTPPRR
jgi:hypothetical protein